MNIFLIRNIYIDIFSMFKVFNMEMIFTQKRFRDLYI